jgi:hypothetical protein
MERSGRKMTGEAGEQTAGRVGWLESGVLIASLVYFAFKAMFFALTVPEGVFPDEVTHFGLAEVFSRVAFLPVDGPETHHLGLVTHTPPLYYFLMGQILKVAPVDGLVLLRTSNVLLACMTVWVAWKATRLIDSDAWTRSLFAVMLTNTLMFTFLAGAVNYDNLVNLLAAVSLHQALLLMRERTLGRVFTLGIALALGALTKLAFLPFAALLAGILLLRERRVVFQAIRGLPGTVKPRGWRESLLAATCVLLALAGCYLYAGNLLRFGRLVPRTEQVLTLGQAMQNRVFARNSILGRFRSGQLSIVDARSLALQIEHGGDRVATLALLDRAMWERAQAEPQRLDRLHYAVPWSDLMLARTYGILAHETFEKRGATLAPYYVFFLFAGIRCVRRVDPSDLSGFATLLLIVVVGYLLILMQAVNYRSYVASGVLELALQGRYAFPVLVPFYLLVSHYLLDWRQPVLRWTIGLAVAVLFVAGEFPWFLLKAPPGFST